MQTITCSHTLALVREDTRRWREFLNRQSQYLRRESNAYLDHLTRKHMGIFTASRTKLMLLHDNSKTLQMT